MGSNWPEYPLTDFYDISSGLSKPAADFGSGHPFVSFKDVFGNYFLPDELVQLVQSTDQERKKCSVKRGDVFLTRTSETMHELGMSSVALRDYENATFNGFTKRLRPKPDCDLVPEYVGYYLRSPRFRHSMLAFSTMSTRASLNNEMIGRLTIEVPPRPVQQSIAHVLKTLDEKVALNRQMNETLEQMAQALFKSWFVDFDPVIDNALDAGNLIPEELEARAEQRRQLRDAAARGEASVPGLPNEIRSLFPNEFELTDEKGWVPKGWSVQPVLSLIELTGGGTPKTTVDEYWDGDIPWFSVVDAPAESDVFVIDTEKHVTQEGIDNSSTKLLRPGTTIISARGTVGKCALVAAPMTMNQSCYAVNGMDGLSDEFVYYLVRYQVGGLQQRSHGSVFSTITRDTFKSIFVASPGAKLTQAYSDYVRSLFDKILSNSKSTTELGRTRDLLLPKLISGELQIPDAEQQIAEVLS